MMEPTEKYKSDEYGTIIKHYIKHGVYLVEHDDGTTTEIFKPAVIGLGAYSNPIGKRVRITRLKENDKFISGRII